ncbi:hypothetical protein TNCV_1843771 [Trichonephila clavipes]|nr:hypothetical protein TNCV_1843771 [Trichonephila clavipes]
MPLCFTISESSFCEILKTLKNRRPCKLPSGINSPTTQCSTACSKTNGRTEKVWMWDHPPYSPGLSPYEFLVFGYMKGRPSGTVISDTDCCAVGPGFESRRRHGCLSMYSAFAAWGYSKWPASSKASHEVGGRGREVGDL